MTFVLVPMSRAYADAIADWHYDGPDSFYDMDRDPEDLAELLDSSNWEDGYRAVLDDGGELVGFFCFEDRAGTLELGLGLRPDYVGKGLGRTFVEAGLEYAQRQFAPAEFSLSVATFNQRAIKVYRSAGFKPDGVFMNETNGAEHEYLRMVRRA